MQRTYAGWHAHCHGIPAVPTENVTSEKMASTHKGDWKTQQYNSLVSLKLMSEACISVLKIRVDGRYCLEDIGAFWLSKGQM